MFDKHIHYSDELEAGILGACMIEKDAFGRTFGILEKEYFYFDSNQIAYEAIAELYSSGFPIDVLTVVDFIFNRKGLKELGSYNTAYYVTKLTNAVVSSANLEYHSFILKRMWMERELIKLTHGGVKLEGEVKQQMAQLNQAIQRINQGTHSKDWTDMSELMYDLIKHQEEMTKTKGQGITTGIEVLDRENGGFFGGQLVIIGARPSVGKSAFMGQMAVSMAKKKVAVGIISLEMNNNEISARLSAIETEDNFKTIYRNLYRDENHRAAWYEKIRKFVNLPIYVSDITNVSAIDIKAKAQKLKHQLKKANPDQKLVIMVDYLQLVSGESSQRGRTRENEVSQISRTCKLVAKELDVPLVVLCQLNRASTTRKGTGRYPLLSDLRESGSIEQDADVVMFIHRDWMLGEDYMKDENGNSTENKADLIVRKWRNGASNLHIDLEFDAPRMLFKQTQNLQQWKPEVNYQDENPF